MCDDKRGHDNVDSAPIPSDVMAGLVPAIHVLLCRKTWMPATSAGMTTERDATQS